MPFKSLRFVFCANIGEVKERTSKIIAMFFIFQIADNVKLRKVFLILSADESEMSFLVSGDLNLIFYRFVKIII